MVLGSVLCCKQRTFVMTTNPAVSSETGLIKLLGRAQFAVPKTEKEVTEARKASVPKKTQTDTKYCMCLWNEWKMH